MDLLDISPSTFGLRFRQIAGDGMEPTLRSRDYVLVAPTQRYAGEGYYLVANHYGDAVAYSCSAAGTRSDPMIRLHRHNKHYRDQLVSRQSFDETVLAQIVMICNVVRPGLLAQVDLAQPVEV